MAREDLNLVNVPKLVIIPGIEKNSSDLAKKVRDILREEFHLGDAVFVFSPLADEKFKGVDRNSYRGFAQGYFKDHDPKAECGQMALRRAVDANYVALVRYMEDPFTKHSINDDLMQIRALGSLLDKTNPARRVLAVPYLPFLRSHSVEKYEQKGFLQADMLTIFVTELKAAGIDRVVSIEPHSSKFMEVAKDNGIDTTIFSPFSDPEEINYLKLGFNTREEARNILDNLGVFSKIVKEQFSNAYLALGDDNAEKMGEAFAYCSGIPFERLVAFNKIRSGEGDSRILGLKGWCKPTAKDLEGTNVLIIDDMISGGGTLNDLAIVLKDNYHVAKVIAMVAHPVCPEPDKIEKLDAVDEIYTLGTVPQQIKRLKVINAHPYMLAAGLYKSYNNYLQRLEAEFQNQR